MRLQVSKERALRPAEREEGHGGCDTDVDPDHAHAHPIAKLARRLPALREDRRRISESGALYHLDAFVEVADMSHRRDGAKDFFLADRHVGLHAVEHRRADEMTTRV